MIKAVPITGKGPLFDVPRMKRDLANLLTSIAKAIKADYGVVTQTWRHKPSFTIDGNQYGRDVYTTDPVFRYVDEGTKAHVIAPKNGKYLVFGGGAYKAKTRPRVIARGGGGGGGGAVFLRRPVEHPGTEAREFTQTIGDKWEAEMQKRARVLWRA